MEVVSYGGWARCARFVVGSLELIVTLEVGPRIIRFGFVDGPNELAQYERYAGLTGGDEFRSYGGHRLWFAPEVPGWTTEPDNTDVLITEVEEWTSFSNIPASTNLQRKISISMSANEVKVSHHIRNDGDSPIGLAPWALTVMEVGGTGIFPTPEYRSHEVQLTPAAPLVLWPYTNLSDSRWTFGQQLIRLRQTDAGPQKIGAYVAQGWAGYANHNNLFLKKFPALAVDSYLDYGCNFETFTRHDMLEVESLGPQVLLQPGESVEHNETWGLFRNFQLPDEDSDAIRQIQGLLDRLADPD